jgi:hypothetical protein
LVWDVGEDFLFLEQDYTDERINRIYISGQLPNCEFFKDAKEPVIFNPVNPFIRAILF